MNGIERKAGKQANAWVKVNTVILVEVVVVEVGRGGATQRPGWEQGRCLNPTPDFLDFFLFALSQ